MPADYVGTRRSVEFVKSILPRRAVNTMVEAVLNRRFDHAAYGLKVLYTRTGWEPSYDVRCSVACRGGGLGGETTPGIH